MERGQSGKVTRLRGVTRNNVGISNEPIVAFLVIQDRSSGKCENVQPLKWLGRDENAIARFGTMRDEWGESFKTVLKKENYETLYGGDRIKCTFSEN